MEIPAQILALRERLGPKDPLRAAMLRTVLMSPGAEFRFDVAERLLAARRPDDQETGPEVLALVPRSEEPAALRIVGAAVLDDTLSAEVRAESLCHVCFWNRDRGRRAVLGLLKSATKAAADVLSRAASPEVRDVLLIESIDEDLEWQIRLRAAEHAYDLDQDSAVDAVVELATSDAVTEEACGRAVVFLLDREHHTVAAYVVRVLRNREGLDADFTGLLAELETAIEQRVGAENRDTNSD
jgi:hypothetical protein